MWKKKVSLKIDPSGKPWKQGLDDVLFDPICQGYQLQQNRWKKHTAWNQVMWAAKKQKTPTFHYNTGWLMDLIGILISSFMK